MTASDLHAALLRPAVLQILKSVGFIRSQSAPVDILTDLAARYLALLADETAKAAISNHSDYTPTIQDVRLALDAVGALRPQMKPNEELLRGTEFVNGELVPFEDLRGVQNFTHWAQGPLNREIRRVAGLSREDDGAADLAAVIDEGDDYLTAMKKKHAKTADDTKYQGTVLGRDGDLQPVTIAGGSVDNLFDWRLQQQHKLSALPDQSVSPVSSGISSAPTSPAYAEPHDSDSTVK